MAEKFKLQKPITYEEKEITELDLDLDALTGRDLTNIEQEFVAGGNMAAVPETSKTYLMYVGARAAKVPVELVQSMSAKDVSRLTVQVQNFLIG